MLVSLQHDRPVIDCSAHRGSVVLEFARYKSWGDQLDRGMHLIHHDRWFGGFLFRVSIHEPTVYNIHTLCHEDMRLTKTGHYTVCLMQGKGHQGWALEIGQGRALVTLVLDYFRQDWMTSMPTDAMTIWDHLNEED